MSHRKSNRIAVLLAGAALMLPMGAQLAAQDDADATTTDGGATLEDRFATPPESARPRVWWHWMNGNVTKEGIRKDFEWMKRVGIGGVQNFDAALQTPQIVEKRLAYMTPEWKDAFRYAVSLADEKGLEFAIAASPGWSETGGPWVPPEDGMKKLVWSEAVVSGGRNSTIGLPAPPTTTGPFQNAHMVGNFAATPTGKPTPTYYQDVAVLAFPQPAGTTLSPSLSVDGTALADAANATDGDYTTSASVPLAAVGETSFVVADFGRVQTVSAATLAIAGAGGTFQGAPASVVLERETAEGEWTKIADIPFEGAQTTVAFAPIEAQRLRLVLTTQPARFLSGLGSVPGAITNLFPSNPATEMGLAELRFSSAETVDRFEVKAGFGIDNDYYDLATNASPQATGIDPAKVVDLTADLREDGTLDWKPPRGNWKILRFGYSLTGTTNHPATAEATGLEVDKFDGAAVARYMDHYIGMMKETVGDGLVGENGIRAILTDSIEVGPSNWTNGMIDLFTEARGYDPRPWMPALTGAVVGTREQSDKFLFDFRQTIAELMANEHYGQVARSAHENDLIVYGEALEAGRPTLGNELAMRQHADVPMAALWTYDPARGPRTGLLGDMKGAASVAHVYGQNVVAAESMTSAFSPWAFAPVDLKPVIDLEFSYGVNRPVVHTSVHQPTDDKLPGLSLGPFGQYFNRHETWAEMAGPWVDYMSRTSLMLQEGRYFADVAYFYGEDAPLTVLYNSGPPEDVPSHYGFDFVNAGMLNDKLRVSGGKLVADSGASFNALYLGGTSETMTLPMLRRIAALAEAGATVIGHAPMHSPSLLDDKAEYDTLVAKLWSGAPVTRVGQGQVIASDNVEEALQGAGVNPDFTTSGDAKIMFVHRRLADGDLYFVNNREADAVSTEARFRVTGKAPELWDAATGTHTPASYRIEGRDTVVPLDLKPHDAVFVVFREDTSETSRTVAATEWATAATIDGAWDVAFQPGRGAPESTTLDQLGPFTDSDDTGIRYFSGVSTYTKSFRLPSGARPGDPVMLDLGQVGDVAEILVNGKSAGIVWKPPYRVDIGSLVKRGSNSLEVRVANLWVNRLIGDAQPDAEKLTFTVMPTYHPDAPLRPSGLIGPVTLLREDGD